MSKAAKDAEAQNENAFDNFESANEKKGLVDTDEYKNFCSNLVKLEKTSPLRMLIKQKHGYGYSGFYHSSVRDYENDPISAFKVQHMNWRVDVPPHAGVKYHLSEDDLFKQLCAMVPIYERRPGRLDVVYRSGDVRSTFMEGLGCQSFSP